METAQNTQLAPNNHTSQRGVSRLEALAVVLVSAMTFPWIQMPRISAAVLLGMGGVSQLFVTCAQKEKMD